MRQAGIIAACGRVALASVDRLAEDHRNARSLGEALVNIPGLRVRPDQVETNMVFLDVSNWKVDAYEAKKLLEVEGILLSEMSSTLLRAVIHRHFSADEIPKVVAAFQKVAARLS